MFFELWLAKEILTNVHFGPEGPGYLCLGLFCFILFLAICSTVQNNFVLYSQKTV